VSPGPDRPCLRRLIAGAAALLLVAGPVASQQPPAQDQPRFRSGVQIVEVDARVFDKDGHFVMDLTRDDFEILESGTPQQLQTLFLVEGPPDRDPSSTTRVPSGPPIQADSEPRSPTASARQTWIFVFDLDHLTPGSGFDRARQAVEVFIRDRFKEGDLAGIVAGSTMVNNRLTSVREELVAATKSVKPRGDARTRQVELTREWPRLLDEEEAIRIAREEREAVDRAVIRACSDDSTACNAAETAVREKARRLQGDIHRASLQTMTAINGLASGLAKIPGPKTIVLLSDGFVVQDIETTLRNVVGQTARAGARVYAIDVRGLNRVGNPGIIDQELVTDEAGPVTRFDASADGPNSLAVDTGGLMIRNENNIGRALDTIARDSGTYYVLGYYPADTSFDGKFRPIEVRVKRAGVRVRARRGYLALEPAKMLLPQPIGTTTANETPAAAGSTAATNRPPEPPAAEPSPTAAEAPRETNAATGSIVAAPSTTVPGAIRLRPGADKRVNDLSERETVDAGELAKRGWEAYQRGDIESAAAAFTKASAQPDVRPWVLYALGLSQAGLGRPADAVASWERVRQAVPEFEPVYIDLADTYAQISDLTNALAVLRDAEKRWPADPEIQNGIGVIHVRRGALDDAIDAFTTAEKAAPDDALTHLNVARTYELRFMRGRRYVSSQRRWIASDEDRQKARQHYERCVQLGGPYAKQASEAIARLDWSKQ
jgi:VWFA-related protein